MTLYLADMTVKQLPLKCVDKLKVVADATRLAVLELLLESPKHVGELNQVIDVEQSLLSHHLKTLRQAGLVVAERDGKAMLYQLAPTVKTLSPMKGLDLGCCVLSFPSSCCG